MEIKMSKVSRFGVSVDPELMAPFDEMRVQRGYSTRSEAIRDLIRQSLAQNSWGQSGDACAVLTLLYDHHRNDLSRRMTAIQHDSHDLIIATMHLHVDHDNCLEILALKGDCGKIRGLADKLAACKGVKYGAFNPIPDGKDLI